MADYPAWRRVYDSVADLQKAGGVTAESVHRTAGDPDNVLVIHEFETLGEAQAFFANENLLDVMRRGRGGGPTAHRVLRVTGRRPGRQDGR